MQKKNKKIALVHDFTQILGGGEKVLKVFADMFPDAPIYTLLYNEKKTGSVFPKDRIRPSGLQKFPKFLRNRQKFLLPFMPGEIEKMDFSEYDIVLSSSGAFSHGIITNSDTKHYCYCHSPMRYAWDWTHEYMDDINAGKIKRILAAILLNRIRMWDKIAADRTDIYIANSRNSQKRIKKYYRKDSKVIYPPVELDRFKPTKTHEDYFLIVSTLTPYKKVDLAVQLFNKIGKQLVIIGNGPQKAYLQSIAGKNISFLGFKSDEVVAQYYQNCRAFIFAGEEDFGITPVEAMACGKPVLAYRKGGTLETVVEGVTGEFFDKQTIESMESGLARLILNEKNYSTSKIRKHAEEFSQDKFIQAIKAIVK